MKKKVLAWVLTVAMVLSNIPMMSFADDTSYSVGAIFTSDSTTATLPSNIPEGTEWVGPQYTRTCTTAAHQHDEDCYCEEGGTSFSHWWHDNDCRTTESACGYAEHIHSEANGCYSYTWTLEEETTSDQHRDWWPVYWGFEDGSRVTSSDVVTVTVGADTVKFASTAVRASTGLADVENENTVDSGTVIDNEGFSVTVDPGYYVVSWRLVCGNRFRCATNDYQDRNYTANSDGDYTSEILVPMDEESFNHWNGFDIQNSNSNGQNYVPVIKPDSTDTNLYDSDAPYPFYLMVYVQRDNAAYEINYDWGILKNALSEYSVPDPENNVIRNASYEVADPDMYGGETAANQLGYRFVGWQISGQGYDEDATVQPGADITCYGSSITLTALWETTVTYQYTGDLIPEGAIAQLPDTKHYETGTNDIAVEAAPGISGYTFSGWTTDDVTIENGKFTMPENPVVFTGSFMKDDNQKKTIAYTVEYYFDHTKNDSIQPDVIVSDTVWTGEDDYLPVNAREIVKDFAGWVFGGSDPDVLPGEAHNGDVIKLYYHNTNVTIDVVKEVKNLTQNTTKDTSVTNPLPAKVGDALEYTITVKNNNDHAAASNIVIYDTLNGYGEIVFTETDNIKYARDQVQAVDVFTIGTIPADSSVAITYSYTVHENDAGQKLTNFAFYSSGEGGDSAYVDVESQYTLTVEHYLDGVLEEDKTFTEAMDKGAAWTVQVGEGPDATYNAPIGITAGGVTYAFDKPATGFDATSGTLTADTTVKLYYAKDEIGTEDPDEPDNIPDKYQVTILYVAEHGGKIADGALTEEVVNVTAKNGDPAEKGIIVATGSEAAADNHYAFAHWTLERKNHAAFETGLGKDDAKFGPYQMPPEGSEDEEAYYAIGGETYIFRAHFIGAELELIKSAAVFSKTRSAEAQGDVPVAEVGDTIEYEIHVHNTGTVHLTDLVVTDTMKNASGEIRYVQAENSNLVSYSAETGKFTVSELQPGQVVTIVYYYDVLAADAGKTIENAAVADLDGDEDPTGTEEVYVKEVNLSVEKTASDYEVKAGETVTWNIVVSNSGKDAGYTALPTDTLTVTAEGQDPTTVELEVTAPGLTAENDGTYKVPGKGSITFVASYTAKNDGTVLTNRATIDGDEDTDEPVTVLKNYTVTYVLQGEIPSGMNAAYAGPTEHAEKSSVTVLAEPTYDPESHGFSGWICEDVEVDDGSFTMPGKNITFVGVFEAYNPDIKVEKHTLQINEQDYVKGTSVAKPGDWITWQITVVNEGDAPGKYTLTDQLAGVTVYDANGQVVSAAQEFTIPQKGETGATQTFTAKYRVKDTDTGSIVNSVKLSSGDDDKTDDEQVPISNLTVSDKSVIKVGDTDIVEGNAIPVAKAGETIVWEITVQNTGDAAATLNVADLDDTVRYKDGDTWVDFTGELGKVTFDVTEINVPAAAEDGTPGQVTVQVSWVVPTAAYGKTLRNLVDADPDDGKDPEPEKPSEEIEVEKQPVSGLVISKDVDKTKVKVGDTVTYTIKVKNSGEIKLIDLVVDETAFSGKFDKIIDIKLSDGITVDKDHDRFVIDELMPDEEVTIEFSYKTTEDGALKNTATVTGQPDRDDDGEPDPDLPDPTGEDKAPDVDVDEEESDGPITPVGPTPSLNKGGDHLSYIIGFPDGSVQPLSTITRAEVATIFFRLLTDESRAHYWSQENPFSDVAAADWCNNAISTMYNAGIVKGYPDGTFGPNDPVSRAEFAAIATRFTEEGRDGVSQKYFKQYFKDVDQNDWYAAAVELAYELGWAQGYQGNYRPEDDMTRAEAMTLVNRIMEREVCTGDMLEDMIHWPDNTPDMWYYEAVQEATNSHTYKRTDVKVPNLHFNYEEWKKLLENPDWAALERTWSAANSQN